MEIRSLQRDQIMFPSSSGDLGVLSTSSDRTPVIHSGPFLFRLSTLPGADSMACLRKVLEFEGLPLKGGLGASVSFDLLYQFLHQFGHCDKKLQWSLKWTCSESIDQCEGNWQY